MRSRTWLTFLALGGVIASVGCEVPTGPRVELCWDIYGCDGPGGGTGEPGPAMRLRVTTVTTGTPLDSTVRYRLDITNIGGHSGVGWSIWPNHTEVLVWGATSGGADHHVALSEVPTHCEVQGENPRTVTIVKTTPKEFEASPIETTFEVVCS